MDGEDDPAACGRASPADGGAGLRRTSCPRGAPGGGGRFFHVQERGVVLRRQPRGIAVGLGQREGRLFSVAPGTGVTVVVTSRVPILIVLNHNDGIAQIT